jgi:hypothetical protein
VELFAALIVGSAVMAVALLFSQRQERARLSTWAAAARRLNLGDIVEHPRAWRLGSRLTGSSQGLGVSLESYRQGKYETGTRIVVDGLGQGAEPLTLKGEGLGTRLFGRKIEIGDAAFDEAVYVQGPEALALAVLDAPARLRLARLLQGEAVAQQEWVAVTAALDRGVLEVRVKDRHSGKNPEQISKVLQSALENAHSLVAPGDLPTRLAQNFRRELIDSVRSRLVQVLGREYPDHPEARQALRDALRDKSSLVRLHAALHLGASEEVLLQALGSGDPAVAEAAARALGKAGTAAAVAPLRAKASSLLPNPLRAAARQAIAEIQARLTGAAPGQLSLAAGEAGALSLAAGEAGELSLAESGSAAEWSPPQTETATETES